VDHQAQSLIFSELIGAELIPTPKRLVVPYSLFYKSANYQKFLSMGSICSKSPNRAIQHRFQTTFRRFCLKLSHFENAITSWILRVSLCMSARLHNKGCRTQWNNPCPSLSPDEIVTVFPISLSLVPGWFQAFA
jgi:hypothetical protein